MKISYVLKTLIIFSILIFPSLVVASDLGELRLSQMDGFVQVQSKGETEWFPATRNFPIQAGDRLWVPKDAHAQLETRSGTVLRFDAESSLEILEVGGDSLHAYLSQGQVYLNYQKMGDSMVQVDTPSSSIRVYDSSTLNIAIIGGSNDREGNAEVSVYRGVALVENREGEIRVSAGKMLAVDAGTPFLMRLDLPNAWEEWNRNEDESLLVSTDDEQYLPQELSRYGRDLRGNGRWISTAEYGSVWTPTTHITVDWVPYRHGRWVWIGDDFVWIGEEPWGWAPYHYGRWTHIPSHGWCWVPPPRNEVYWGPGFVSWVQTTTTVAWVPLAPREMYYGYGNYGPHSINIVNININNYYRIDGRSCRNASVHGAVTSLERESFVHGRYQRHKEHDNPFLLEPIHIGRPQMQPHRDIKMPVFKEIPHDQKPPMHFRSFSRLPDDSLRKMVKDRHRSVYSPDVTPPPITPPVRDKKDIHDGRDRLQLHRQGAPDIDLSDPERRGKEPVLHRQGPLDTGLPDLDRRGKEPVPHRQGPLDIGLPDPDRRGKEPVVHRQGSPDIGFPDPDRRVKEPVLHRQGPLDTGLPDLDKRGKEPVPHRQGPPDIGFPDPDRRIKEPVLHRQGQPVFPSAQKQISDDDEKDKYPVFGGRSDIQQREELERNLRRKTIINQGDDARQNINPGRPQPRVMPSSPPKEPIMHRQGAVNDARQNINPGRPQPRVMPSSPPKEPIMHRQGTGDENRAPNQGVKGRSQIEQEDAQQRAVKSRPNSQQKTDTNQENRLNRIQSPPPAQPRVMPQQQHPALPPSLPQRQSQPDPEAVKRFQKQQAEQQAAQQAALEQGIQQGEGNNGRGSFQRQRTRP